MVLQTGRLSSGSSRTLCVGVGCASLSGMLEGRARRKQMPDISIMVQIMKIILLELRIRVSFERKCRECLRLISPFRQLITFADTFPDGAGEKVIAKADCLPSPTGKVPNEVRRKGAKCHLNPIITQRSSI